jgi:quercetin dioxygenase-like cupin family protein
MRRSFYLALFVLALATPVLAQDAVKVDPKHYKVEFQNASVRVLRVHYGPHEKSVWHSHPNGVAIAVTDSHVKFNLPGGKSREETLTAGQVIWTPAGKHLPENLSDSDFEVILVELKSKRRAAPKKPAATTATTATSPKKQ